MSRYINEHRECHLCGKATTVHNSEVDDSMAFGNQRRKRICRECIQKRFNLEHNIKYE